MQNKGLIKLFAILFGLVSLYQLSFTWLTNDVEESAKIYAESRTEDGEKISELERAYLDSVANKPVIDLGFAQFSYNDIKNKELNLGLDLKGGMNVTLEVAVSDVVRSLSNNSTDPVFTKAMNLAITRQKSNGGDFIDLFAAAVKETLVPTQRLNDAVGCVVITGFCGV